MTRSGVASAVMDAGVLVGVILLIPLAILIVGAPIVLVVRLILGGLQLF
jgi:hypothetical protein